MIKYEVYADGDNRPVKKLKREREAIAFIGDVRNLARFGCLTLVRESDNETSIWDAQQGVWKQQIESEPQMEGYV